MADPNALVHTDKPTKKGTGTNLHMTTERHIAGDDCVIFYTAIMPNMRGRHDEHTIAKAGNVVIQLSTAM